MIGRLKKAIPTFGGDVARAGRLVEIISQYVDGCGEKMMNVRVSRTRDIHGLSESAVEIVEANKNPLE